MENKIIGACFFDVSNDQAVGVSGQRCQDTLKDLSNQAIDVDTHSIQHDCAICLTTRPNMDTLQANFPGRLTSYLATSICQKDPQFFLIWIISWIFWGEKVDFYEPTNIAQLKGVIHG